MNAAPKPAGRARRGAGLMAVDLGGTQLRIAVFSSAGEMLAKHVVGTPAEDPDALPRLMREQQAGAGTPVALAVVGVPGALDYTSGQPLTLPNLPAWEGRLSAAQLAADLDLPVLLANDADLAALSEYHEGAGRGVEDMLYVTVSTGIGAGVIVGGHLLHGRYSLAEAGHMILDVRRGETLEQLGSGSALEIRSGDNAATVTASALAGDRRAQVELHEIARAAAAGIVNLVYCFMPERVVIGGGLTNAGDLLLDPIRALLAARRPRHSVTAQNVVLARGGDDAGLRGAFVLGSDLSLGTWAGRPLTPVPPPDGGS